MYFNTTSILPFDSFDKYVSTNEEFLNNFKYEKFLAEAFVIFCENEKDERFESEEYLSKLLQLYTEDNLQAKKTYSKEKWYHNNFMPSNIIEFSAPIFKSRKIDKTIIDNYNREKDQSIGSYGHERPEDFLIKGLAIDVSYPLSYSIRRWIDGRCPFLYRYSSREKWCRFFILVFGKFLKKKFLEKALNSISPIRNYDFETDASITVELAYNNKNGKYFCKKLGTLQEIEREKSHINDRDSHINIYLNYKIKPWSSPLMTEAENFCKDPNLFKKIRSLKNNSDNIEAIGPAIYYHAVRQFFIRKDVCVRDYSYAVKAFPKRKNMNGKELIMRNISDEFEKREYLAFSLLACISNKENSSKEIYDAISNLNKQHYSTKDSVSAKISSSIKTGSPDFTNINNLRENIIFLKIALGKLTDSVNTLENAYLNIPKKGDYIKANLAEKLVEEVGKNPILFTSVEEIEKAYPNITDEKMQKVLMDTAKIILSDTKTEEEEED